MNKKAESLSINVIITATIALVVLVVLLAIFASRTQIVAKQIDSCTNAKGICTYTQDCQQEYNTEYALGTNGCLQANGEGYKCCISI